MPRRLPILIAAFSASLFAGCSGGASSENLSPQDFPVNTRPRETSADSDGGPTTPACPYFVSQRVCLTVTTPPTDESAIQDYIRKIALPLQCDLSGKTVWGLAPLTDRFSDMRVFMLGEIHGSNEIGIVSSLVFEALAQSNQVNVVALEHPVDLEASIQHYINTGSDETFDKVLGGQAANQFSVLLPRTARKLVEKGASIRVVTLDIPYNPSVAADTLRALAMKLSSQRAGTIAALPSSLSSPPTTEQLSTVDAFFNTMNGKREALCSELSASDCDAFFAWTHALWASAHADDGDQAGTDLWFSRREEFLYYNLRRGVLNPNDKMFAHMGSFHTNKYFGSAGSRLAREYGPTKDLVYSTAPAYEDGSVVWYGKDVPLPADPPVVASAFANSHPFPSYVPATEANRDCVANPLGRETDLSVVGAGTRADLYDGYIFYGKLTPETQPKTATLKRDDASLAARFSRFRERIVQREGAAIAAIKSRR